MQEQIQPLLDEGYTNSEIAQKLQISSATVTYWKKKLGYTILNNRVDWAAVQREYDSGKTLRELGVSLRAIQLAQMRGDFIARSMKEANELSKKRGRRYSKHTDATKEKLREHMKRRLADGTYPTLGRNFRGRKQSYPEQWWSSVISNHLPNSNVIAEYQYGIYSLDFAWPDRKKCLEVDGAQHEQEKQKESDIRKDTFLHENGWQVLRLPWKETVAAKKEHIGLLIEFLNEA